MSPWYPHHHSSSPFNHYHHYYTRRFMGPSRLIWFGLGAGFASFIWSRNRERDGGQYVGADGRHYGYQSRWESSWGHCRRPTVVPPPPNMAGGEPEQPGAYVNTTPPPPVPRAHQHGPPTREWSPGWDEEKLARQMTDLTDATLDSVLATAQALKQKLAEHRVQREKERERLLSNENFAPVSPPAEAPKTE